MPYVTYYVGKIKLIKQRYIRISRLTRRLRLVSPTKLSLHIKPVGRFNNRFLPNNAQTVLRTARIVRVVSTEISICTKRIHAVEFTDVCSSYIMLRKYISCFVSLSSLSVQRKVKHICTYITRPYGNI